MTLQRIDSAPSDAGWWAPAGAEGAWWPCGHYDRTNGKGERLAGVLVVSATRVETKIKVVPFDSMAVELLRVDYTDRTITIATQLGIAIIEGRRVVIDYRKPGEDAKERQLEFVSPHKIGTLIGAIDVDRQAPRTFKLELIEAVRVLGAP